jgi:hypothetical protein
MVLRTLILPLRKTGKVDAFGIRRDLITQGRKIFEGIGSDDERDARDGVGIYGEQLGVAWKGKQSLLGVCNVFNCCSHRNGQYISQGTIVNDSCNIIDMIY